MNQAGESLHGRNLGRAAEHAVIVGSRFDGTPSSRTEQPRNLYGSPRPADPRPRIHTWSNEPLQPESLDGQELVRSGRGRWLLTFACEVRQLLQAPWPNGSRGVLRLLSDSHADPDVAKGAGYPPRFASA
jgi:hypothetical protein